MTSALRGASIPVLYAVNQLPINPKSPFQTDPLPHSRYARILHPESLPLTLRGSGAVESNASVGKLKRNTQPLFRGESPGFVNLLLCQHVAKLTGTSRSIQTG
jgi:hypothetical protein